MRSVRHLSALSVPVALAAALTLTGCASDDAPAPASSATSQGDDTAADAEDASDEAAGDALTQDEFFERYVEAMRGAGSFTQHMDMGGVQTIDADVVVHDGAMNTDLSSSSETGDGIHMIVVDGRAFYEIAGYTDGFVEAKLDDPEDGMSASIAASLDQVDPAATLDPIKSSTTSFTAAEGTEELDGVVVREYTIVVDTAKMLASNPAVAAGADMSMLPETLEYHFWVGVDDDLTRKITYSLMDSDVVTTMTDFGGDQKVEAPSEDEMGTVAGS